MEMLELRRRRRRRRTWGLLTGYVVRLGSDLVDVVICFWFRWKLCILNIEF